MKLQSKNIILFLFLIVTSTVLASFDPFGIKVLENSAIQAFYFFPAFAYLIFALTKSHYGRRSTASEEKAEKIKSLVRSGLQILGTLIGLAAAFNLDIPLINSIRQAVGYLSENIDVAANAVLALIGVGTTLYGYFKNPERFVERGSQVEGKELIQ